MRYKKGDQLITEEQLEKWPFTEKEKAEIRKHPESPEVFKKYLNFHMDMYQRNNRGIENMVVTLPQEFFLGFLDDAVGKAVSLASGDLKGKQVQRAMEKSFSRARRQSPGHAFVAAFAPDILDVLTLGASYLPRKGYKLFKGIGNLADIIRGSKEFKKAMEKGPEAVIALIQNKKFLSSETFVKALYGTTKGAATAYGETSVTKPQNTWRNVVAGGGVGTAISLITSGVMGKLGKATLYKALADHMGIDPKEAIAKLKKYAGSDKELSKHLNQVAKQSGKPRMSDDMAMLELAKYYRKKGISFEKKSDMSPKPIGQIQSEQREKSAIGAGQSRKLLKEKDSFGDNMSMDRERIARTKTHKDIAQKIKKYLFKSPYHYTKKEILKEFNSWAARMKQKVDPKDKATLNSTLSRVKDQIDALGDSKKYGMEDLHNMRQGWDGEVNYSALSQGDPGVAASNKVAADSSSFYRGLIGKRLGGEDTAEFKKYQKMVGDAQTVLKDIDPEVARRAGRQEPGMPITKYGVLQTIQDTMREKATIPMTRMVEKTDSLSKTAKGGTIKTGGGSGLAKTASKVLTGADDDRSYQDLNDDPDSELDRILDTVAEKIGIPKEGLPGLFGDETMREPKSTGPTGENLPDDPLDQSIGKRYSDLEQGQQQEEWNQGANEANMSQEPDPMYPEDPQMMSPEQQMPEGMDAMSGQEQTPFQQQRQQMQEQKQMEQELKMHEKLINTGLARNTKDFLANKEFSIAKINAQLEPEMAENFTQMLTYNPELLEENLLLLNQMMPTMLQYDPYKRINGIVTDNAIKAQLRKKIFDDAESTNYDKVARLNKLNQYGMYDDPQPMEGDQTGQPPQDAPPAESETPPQSQILSMIGGQNEGQ